MASSLVAYRTKLFSEIFAAPLQPARWKTPEFLDAT
jgi:hypothetical protein